MPVRISGKQAAANPTRATESTTLPADVSLPPLNPKLVPSAEQVQQEQQTLRITFALLVVLCLASLGSLPLVPSTALTIPAPRQPQITISEGGGTCTASPTSIHYLNPSTQTLPASWQQAGLSAQDFATAQACAASFVIAYQSFDYRQPRSFESATALLTSSAQQRFSGRSKDQPADPHMDPLWRAGIQKQQIKQRAQVVIVTIVKSQIVESRVLAWIHVHYTITSTRNGETLSLPPDDLTILIVSLPHNQGRRGTGWQVSDWRTGKGAFPLPSII